MASSATLTTTHLPRLRSLLGEWTKEQPPAKGFSTPLDAVTKGAPAGKDVIVAFRTRPPLPNEASDKFHGEVEGEDGDKELNQPIEFCTGISVTRYTL